MSGNAASFKDHFSGHSADYARFRPQYPAAFFDAIRDHVAAPRLALDCATGNGQLALGLTPFCERIVATDASSEQVAAATPHPAIEYRVAAAEDSGLPDGSVDLLTVGQALHWFDHARFAAEAERVIAPDGILVCVSYATCQVNADIDAVVSTLYVDLLDPYWPPERALVENRYATIELPGTELRFPALDVRETWHVDAMLGYLRTWSASKRYEQDRGHDPVSRIEARLRDAWGDEDRTVAWPLTVRATRLVAG